MLVNKRFSWGVCGSGVSVARCGRGIEFLSSGSEQQTQQSMKYIIVLLFLNLVQILRGGQEGIGVKRGSNHRARIRKITCCALYEASHINAKWLTNHEIERSLDTLEFISPEVT